MQKIRRCFYAVFILGLLGSLIDLLIWYCPPESVNYKYLETLLRANDWENADRETSKIVLLKASER